MKSITLTELNQITLRALSRTYLREIIKATPGQGNAAGTWDITIRGDEIVIFNEEWGDVIRYIEEGTKEHIIRAKNKKFLRFKKPEKSSGKPSKKIPGNQAFEADGYIFAKAVYHPGIEARLFIHKILNDANIAKAFDAEFEKLLKVKLEI
jgi:hypothetical protein